jgi:hypothetical protein
LNDAFTQYAPTRGFALILGFGLLAWGVWVALPFLAFHGAMYSLMLHLASEFFWGCMFMFSGISMLYGVWKGDIEWIRRGSFLGFALWFIIAMLGFYAEPTAVTIVTRNIIALLHAWLYLQVKIHPQLITGAIKIPDLDEFVQLRETETKHTTGGKHVRTDK